MSDLKPASELAAAASKPFPGDSAEYRCGEPDPTPLWNILDLTSGGRGTDWYPKLA